MKSIIRVIVAVCLLMAAAAQASEQGGISAELKSRYYGGVLCAYKQFNCIKVKPGDTWAKLFPDKRQRDLVKRLNRMNLPLRYRQWIVVPTDLAHVDYFDLS